jgi:hypothetical protein
MKPVVIIVILLGIVAAYGIYQSVSLSKDHEYFRVEVEAQLEHMTRTGDDAIKAEIAHIAGAYGIDPATLQVDITRSETPGAPHVPGMNLPGQTTRTVEARVRYTRPILFWDHEFELRAVVRKVNTPHPQEKSMQDALKELLPKPATQ